MLTHALTFLFSAAIVWFFAGILVDSTSRIARKFNRSGFVVAFLILGLLTSIGEISVSLNSVLDGVPQVSAGNLAGASLVIFLLIIPFLAIFGGGVNLSHSLRKRDVLLALAVILLPSLLLMDGSASVGEGFIMIAAYIVLLSWIVTNKGIEKAADEIEEEYVSKLKKSILDIAKVITGGALIFLSSNILVEEAVYFSDAFRVPASFIGLLILSIGTNVPELVIAIRAVFKRRKDIAFGDYIGSAATNTLIMGIMAMTTKGFGVARTEFVITSIILGVGLGSFFIFSSTEQIFKAARDL